MPGSSVRKHKRVALATGERDDGSESREGEQTGRRLRNHGAWSCTVRLEAVDEVPGQNVVLPEAGPVPDVNPAYTSLLPRMASRSTVYESIDPDGRAGVCDQRTCRS